jgi:hypothetical protein
MIDFTPVWENAVQWPDFAAKFSRQDLVEEINQLTDTLLEVTSKCSDRDVVFTPHDPEAHDPYAENPEDVDLSWNLGHVIAHITASNEEAAFIGAELARGVPIEPRRSRYEVAWQSVTSIEQVRQRLAESRRMVLASLDLWPDQPHLENFYESPMNGMHVTPILRVLYGFAHASDHLEQIEEIIRQALTAKE